MSIKVGNREFTHPGLAERYRRSLDEERVKTQVDRGKDDIANAPGGPQHEHDIRNHGIALETTVKNDGPGRWKLTTVHADNYKSQSIHPESYRAHQMAGNYLGIEPPPAIQTHSRARAQPTGPKEKERIDREDGREEETEER